MEFGEKHFSDGEVLSIHYYRSECRVILAWLGRRYDLIFEEVVALKAFALNEDVDGTRVESDTPFIGKVHTRYDDPPDDSTRSFVIGGSGGDEPLIEVVAERCRIEEREL